MRRAVQRVTMSMPSNVALVISSLLYKHTKSSVKLTLQVVGQGFSLFPRRLNAVANEHRVQHI